MVEEASNKWLEIGDKLEIIARKFQISAISFKYIYIYIYIIARGSKLVQEASNNCKWLKIGAKSFK